MPLDSSLLLCDIPIDGLSTRAQLHTELSFGLIYIPVGTCLLKGSLLLFHTSATNQIPYQCDSINRKLVGKKRSTQALHHDVI